VIRVEWLSGPTAFLVAVAAVLLPPGLWLVSVGSRPPRTAAPRRVSPRIIVLLALAVGVIGGIYGIGGGSVLAPILLALGFSVFDVAGAALAATFLTPVVGVVANQVLQLKHGGTAPDWALGLAMCVSGLAGSYMGAHLRGRKPERLIRQVLGLLVVASPSAA